jgi:hypothetical protein
MTPHEALRIQLQDDLLRLQNLILRYAGGDRSVKSARDQLEGAVQVKFALLREERRENVERS